MRIEIKRRVNRNTGVSTFHYLKADRKDGRTVRRYVPRGRLTRCLMEQFEQRKARLILSSHAGDGRAARKSSRNLRRALSAGLAGAGFRIGPQGKLVRMRDSFFTQPAAACRFLLMDPALKATLGSAGNLLAAEIRADSILHSARRKGLKGVTFESCFQHVLDDLLPH